MKGNMEDEKKENTSKYVMFSLILILFAVFGLGLTMYLNDGNVNLSNKQAYTEGIEDGWLLGCMSGIGVNNNYSYNTFDEYMRDEDFNECINNYDLMKDKEAVKSFYEAKGYE